jgi:hypothetical protein
MLKSVENNIPDPCNFGEVPDPRIHVSD